MSDTPVSKLKNPFVGLRAFEEKEHYLFFGRNEPIEDLSKKLIDSRFLAVIGSSGSGKSSLVKSGLLPNIFSGFFTPGRNWRVALMRPGEDPIGYLAAELISKGSLYSKVNAESDLANAQIIESSLRRSENGLIQVYREALGLLQPDKNPEANKKTDNLLIVVDQFEELFRFRKYEKENTPGKSDAQHFIKLLLTASQQSEYPVYILLTMRSDFLGDCSQFIGLPEAINRGQYLVPRMTRDDIREAITGPVAISTATISQRLVTRLLNDINNDSDQLPVLQHAMMRTWDAWYNRNKHDSPIDFADYEEIGTMKAALSDHANEAYKELKTPQEQKICELMFKALTDKAADVRGIRRPRSVADLCQLTGATEAEIINEVEIFRKTGRTFLMPPPGIALTGESIIDISHESLMRVWDKLKVWADKEAQSGDVYLRLARDAERAAKLLKEKNLHSVLVNPELDITLKWFNENKPTAKWAEGYKGNFEQAMAYLEDSRMEDFAEKKIIAEKEATRKRLVKTIFVLLGLLVIAGIILSSVFYGLKNDAEAAKKIAIAAKERADKSAQMAIDNLNLAIQKQREADSSAHVADSSAKAAMHSDSIASDKAKDAIKQREIAEKEKKNALIEKAHADTLSRTSAVGEYQRLIREGPEDRDSINRLSFQYKVVAYCEHLKFLKDSFQIKNAEKKNNELYEKLYFSLKALKSTDVAIVKENNIKAIRTNSLKPIDDPADSLKIISARNNILVIKSNSSIQKTDSIYMGKEVTGLAYLAKADLMVFGLLNGEIGFIKYSANKKKQAVIHRKNDLQSRITSMEFFNHNNKDYLLVTSYLGQAVVFEQDVMFKIDSSEIRTKFSDNIKLPVIELPEYYGQIENGKYIDGKIRLETSKGTYLWNPFTDELLDKLEKKLDAGVLAKNKNTTRIYK